MTSIKLKSGQGDDPGKSARIKFCLDSAGEARRACRSVRVTVFGFTEHLIYKFNRTGRPRTAECYRASLESFKRYRRGNDLYFDMFTDDMMERYEAYLRQNNLCRNTTSFYLRNLRSIANKAVKEGIATEAPSFSNVYTGVDKTAKRAVGLKEIKRLKYLDLSADKELDFARDIFMFSFYTRGMSFIDIAYLRKKNLSNGYLAYSRKKTGQLLTVKWRDEMERIVSKYDTSSTRYLLPVIECEDGTERKQYLRKMLLVNRRLKTVALRAGISVPLTMYVARHSWASIARDKRVPVHVISNGMGNNSELTTEIYLSSIQNSRIDEANDKIMKNL